MYLKTSNISCSVLIEQARNIWIFFFALFPIETLQQYVKQSTAFDTFYYMNSSFIPCVSVMLNIEENLVSWRYSVVASLSISPEHFSTNFSQCESFNLPNAVLGGAWQSEARDG